MRSMRSLPLLTAFFLTVALLSSATAKSQAAAPAIRIVNPPRIVNPTDESSLVPLAGNTHPAANPRNDRGRVSPDLPMTDLILVLSRSPEQQAAFDKFVAGQYDPKSPNFHQWLSPDEVGAGFGPSPADIATISNWLTGHGLTIVQVTRDRMSIRFSGSAIQVESAFHTEIHNLEVKGVAHIANMSDPQIPSALAPVVVGVKSLHNFFPRPQHRTGSQVTRDPATGKWQRVADRPLADLPSSAPARPLAPRPLFNTVDTNGNLREDVSPYDFATIYNVLPLWQAATPIDGTGQTIAIAGTSDICVGQNDSTCQNGAGTYNNDVTNFRSAFGLPAYTAANQPTIVSGNTQPLTNCNTTPYGTTCTQGDFIENSIDVEWSGAVAPGANIVLVASYPSSSSDDNLYDSESYIVNNQIATIMNVSYGGCELGMGTAGNVEYYNLWQTASSEGIAVFVAAGDGGSAMCDQGGDSVGNPYSAQYGLTVNGLASTPFNTAVGGTDFNWCSLTSTCAAVPYWNANNKTNGSSAVGYVPEVPWNDTCASSLALGFLEQQATNSGITGVNDAESACNFVYSNSLTSGGGLGLAPLVDTVGAGGGASGCVVNDGASVSSCTSTTTSTGAGNGSIPLVNDGWPKPGWQAGVSGIPNDGVRDLPDVSFFASNGFAGSAYLICISALNSNAPCTYSSTQPTAEEIGGTSVASPAMAGVMALINQMAGQPQGNPNAELYLLASKQTWSSCKAETVTTSGACLFNDIDSDTNAVPCDYGAEEGGVSGTGILSPDCSVKSGSGDLIGILPGYSAGAGYDQATGLGSLNVGNVALAWPATTATSLPTVTVKPNQTTIAPGAALNLQVTVASSGAGGTTPTGKVWLVGGDYAAGAQTLSASGVSTFAIGPNSLALGNDVFTVSYGGDSTYAAATGTATVSVAAPLPVPTVTVIPSASTLTAGGSINVAVAVTPPSSGSATPTGSVTLTCGGYTSGPQALTSSGAFTFQSVPGSGLPVGSDTLTVTYSGDSNYASAAGTAGVTVTAGLATAAVTVTPTPASLIQSGTLSVAVTVASTSGSGATPTGTVTLGSGSYTSAAQTLSGGAATFASIPGSSLALGSNTLTVTYSGDSTYASATGTAGVTVTGTAAATVTVTPALGTISQSGTLSVAVTVASTSGSGATPTGTVTLGSGSYTSAPQTLSGGAATFASIPGSSLALGTDTLTVTYSGDSTYASATGTANEAVTATSSSATFSLSASTTTAVSPGTAATSTISVSSASGYVGIASLGCALTSSDPSSVTDAPTCALSPSTVTLTAGSTSGSVTATVSTTAATTGQLAPRDRRGKGWLGAGGGAILAFLVFLGIPARRRSWRSMLGALLVLAVLGCLSGCGDFWQAPGGNTAAGTTAGTYTFTVTGTGIPTITPVTTTFTVTVN